MKKKPKGRTTISIHPDIYKMAEEIMVARKFSGFSTLLEQLFREEHERRTGQIPVIHMTAKEKELLGKSGLPPKSEASEQNAAKFEKSLDDKLKGRQSRRPKAGPDQSPGSASV